MERVLKLWENIWKKYFEFYDSIGLVKKLTLSLFFAILTGISAQIYIKLPFTPVPITMQTFVVLLSGILLGRNFGSFSQIFYFLGGITGIGWFCGGTGGLLRPTTGYIIGFIFASYIVGFFSEKKNSIFNLILGMLLATITIYLSGCLWLTGFTGKNFKEILLIGVYPFIPFDILKAYMAGIISKSILKGRTHEKV